MADNQLSRADIDALTASFDTVTLPPAARALLSDVIAAISQAIGDADAPVAVAVEVDQSVREKFDAAFTPDPAPHHHAGGGVVVSVKKIGR